MNKDDWIPCDEKMPEKCEYVLCCNEWGEMNVAMKMEIGWESQWDIHWACEEIIAWQPLPDPYKKEE